MARYSVSAVGADRPGIVAAVSGALGEAGCNLEDSTMAVLQGQFAVLLVVSSPVAGEAELAGALAPVAERLELSVVVRALHEAAAPLAGGASTPTGEGEAWTVAVQGADRPGIVHGVTAALAAAGGNVVDLATHLTGEEDRPLYVLTLRATFPPGEAGRATAEAVRRAADALGVHCSVRRDDAEIL